LKDTVSIDVQGFLDNNNIFILKFIGIVFEKDPKIQGNTRFVEKYVTGRRKRFRPHKVNIFLIRITSRVSNSRGHQLKRILWFFTRRVKGYTRFVGKYVTGRWKRFRPNKVHLDQDH